MFAVTNIWGNQLKVGKMYLGLRGFCPRSEVLVQRSAGSIALGLRWDRGSMWQSAHLMTARKQREKGQDTFFPEHTLSDLLSPARPHLLLFIIFQWMSSYYETIKELIHSLDHSPQDPITSQTSPQYMNLWGTFYIQTITIPWVAF
jgi:hypothetical protein